MRGLPPISRPCGTIETILKDWRLEMEAIRSAVENNGRPYSLGAPPPENLFSFHTYFGGALNGP